MLLLLLLGGLAGARAQQADRQKAADRRFLLSRGIGFDPALGAASSPVPALAAARGQKQALAIQPARSPVGPRSTAKPFAQAGQSGQSQAPWQPLGPLQVNTPAYGLVTGRISSLAVDGSDATGSTVYVGATGGGVWKSSADPQTGKPVFRPLTDDLGVFQVSQPYVPSLSIGALSLNPNNNQTILAGTGDPNDALDSYYGVGILRSTDGGSTWSQITQSSDSNQQYSFVGAGFAGFAWSTTTANLVVAAVAQSREGRIAGANVKYGPTPGLYYSTDAGQTWFVAGTINRSNGSPPIGVPATSVVWNRQRGMFLAAVQSFGYYSSPDGKTWTRLARQPGAGFTSGCESYGTCPIQRGVLAVQPLTGDTFALTVDVHNKDQGLFQDVCSSSGLQVNQCNTSATPTWGTQRNTVALEDGTGVIPAADYNLALAAVPSQTQQDTLLFVGTEDIFRCSLANSCTWRNTTNTGTCNSGQVAPSVHAIDGSLAASGLLYFGTDGGLWRTPDWLLQTGPVCSANDAGHFDNLNGGLGSLAEVSHFAATPNNGSLVLAGLGALGVAGSARGTGIWQQLLTGEGSYVAIDPNTPSNWLADAFPGLGIFHCPSGANCTTIGFGASPAIARADVNDDTDDIVTNGYPSAPWILDPGNPANVLLGTCRMWLGSAGGGWSGSNLLSVPLDGAGGSVCNGNSLISAVGAGGSYNTGGERMYAGMAALVNGGRSTPGGPGRSVPGHIFGATVPQSGGVVTWTDLWRNPVTNQLNGDQQFNPSGGAISTIAFDPSDTSGKTVYVGIAGFPQGQGGIIYRSTDGGATWANLTNNLVAAPVNKIVVDPNNPNDVYVAGDFGVYWTQNVGNCVPRGFGFQACWQQLSSGLPNAPITDLQVVNSNGVNVLEASTYGRGIWTIGLTTSSVPAQATLSPGSASFDATGVGAASPGTRSFTLQNNGSVPLNIGQILASPADYTQTNQCGATLATGASCPITVTFKPTATGDRPGTLSVIANTQPGTTTASLDGQGLPPGHLSVSPGTVSFPTTATGSISDPQSVTLTNDVSNGAPIQLTGRSLSGTNPAEFALTTGSTCGSSLAAGATCTVPVVFQPSMSGTRTAVLTFASSANNANVNLTGQGVTPAHLTWTPTSLQFPDTGTGNASSAQSITVTNTGQAAAQLGMATLGADYTLAADGCSNLSLGGSKSCTVSIKFTPKQQGARPSQFTLPTTSVPAGDVPSARLNGTGLPPPFVVLSPNPVAFDPQQQGTISSVHNVTVTNSGGSEAQFTPPAVTGDSDFAVANNTCGSTLGPNGATCTIGLTFTPSQPNSRPNGTLSVPYGSNGTAATTLTGTGTAPAALTLSPNPVTFATTAAGATSAASALLVRNTGGNPATLNALTVTGPFAIASTDCPATSQTLAANGGQCTINLTFTPPGTQTYSGQVTLTGGFSNSPVSATLRGQGAAPPNASITPNSWTFPDTPQNSPSTAQTFTVASTGGVAVTLGPPTLSTSDYYVSNQNCPQSLKAGDTCQVQVVFHPSAPGLKPATLQLTTDSSNGPLTANLSGTGAPPGQLSISPGSMQFGTRVIGTTSPTQMATVSNTGGTPIALGTLSTNADYAIQSTTCGATLAPSSACSVNVAFTPTARGDRQGQLTIPGDGAEASAVTTLDGNGVTPGKLAFSPPSLGFGNVATDANATLSATVTNSGDTTVHFSSIAATGDFAVTGGTCVASTTLLAAATCTIQVTFTPSTKGSSTGTLTIANDGSPAFASEALTGTGIDPGKLTITPAGLDFGQMIVNKTSASQAIHLANGGGSAITLGSPTLSNAAFSLTSGDCGSTLPVNTSCTVQIAFRPQQHGQASGTFSLAWKDTGSGGGTAQVGLAGSGVNPGSLTFAPNPVQFGPVVIGSSSFQTVSVTNNGDLALPLGAPFTSGGYSVANGCGGSLAAGASCRVQVAFAPAGKGDVQGLLTIPASDGSGTWADPLDGAGVPPGSIQASPGKLMYAGIVIGQTSAPQTVTFSNPGGVSVPLNSVQSSSPEYAAQSSCGQSLDPNGACTVAVTFTPSARGDRPATLTLSGGGSSAVVALDGPGLAPAQLGFSPAALDFGTQAEQTRTRTPQTLTLRNTGDVATQLGLPILSGQYVLANDSCVDSTTGLGVSLGGGAACTVGVEFQPTASGVLAGSLAIADVSGAPAAQASLSGTGRALTLDPATLTFDRPLLVGQSYTSPTLISISNLDRNKPLALQPLTITGDFAIVASTCTASLPPDTACSLYVAFTPSAGGKRTGTLTASTGSETQTTQLVGIGLTPPTDTLSATSLAFPPTAIGLSSPVQSITLTNSGDAALMQIAAVTTANNRPFSVANNCGPSLPGHASCSLAVEFIPQAIGSVSGTLTITDALHTQVVTLNGQGTLPPLTSQASPPQASPSSLDFGGYALGVATQSQTVTISNINRSPLTLASITQPDDPSYTVSSSSCKGVLDPGASCQMTIVFTPAAVGAHASSLKINGMVGSTPESTSIGLAGSGEDFQLAVTDPIATASSVPMRVITQGQTAVYSLNVLPVGASSGTVTIGCSGAPANTTCTANPSTVAIAGGAPGFVKVSIVTNTTASSGKNPASRWWTGGAALALLCPVLFLRGDARRRLLVAAAAVLTLVSPIACGVHATGVQANANGTQAGQTPTGTYTITLKGDFPGAERTATVQLVVQ